MYDKLLYELGGCMDVEVSERAGQADLDARLDQLIPPPMSWAPKLLVGGGLITLAVAVTFLNIGGYLIPAPFKNVNFSSAGPLIVDSDRGLIGARVMIPNNSRRDVRVVEVSLDSPGAELVEASLIFEPDDRNQAVGDSLEVVALPGADFYPTGVARVVPSSIGAGETAFLLLWFRPSECVDRDGPWGFAEVTFDFGEGAFPPFAKTQRVDSDPVWDGDEALTVVVDDEFLAGSDLPDLPAAGPLALACEVLR